MLDLFLVLLDFATAFILLASVFFVIRRSGRRFEAEQRKRGLWDENGPIHPTTLPSKYRITETTLRLNLEPSDVEPEDDDPLSQKPRLWEPK